MRNILAVFLILTSLLSFSQSNENKKTDQSSLRKNKKIEDQNGRLIIDPVEREIYFKNKQIRLDLSTKKFSSLLLTQTAVPLCTNGSFEEFENIAGNTFLKNFLYTTGEPLNPMQCKSVSENANQGIKLYDPADFNLMASTVPSNYLDEFIGNINAFDQFSLKINYKNSSQSMGLVQAKRFKTNNETSVKFNYKAVLQSIDGNDHQDEQPYFKARVVNNSGTVVSEFCLIADPTNCIFTQAPNLEGGSIVLYTKNWQSGILDISNIPNNEEFTIEFMASRCGLSGHFGYAYIDDICLLHSNESLQGSIELDPLYKVCPSLPISVCGSFTIPNSNGISATVASIILNVHDASNAIVFTSPTPVSLDLATHRFCFDLVAANLPNIATGSYNVSATINYSITQTACSGTNFSSITDDDANPGWDIWFLNCTNCPITLQTANLTLCDTNHNGKEFFNLTNANPLIAGAQTGLTFAYFDSLSNATNNTNAIVLFANYESWSTTIFVRVTQTPTCYKIVPIQLIVKNPSAYITGILNICSGSTVLTASPGNSFLWYNGATTQSITVNSIGTYTVAVTDSNGCTANGSVTILSNMVAPYPSITVTQPTCFTSTGSIEITSPASDYSYDDGVTWVTNSILSNLGVGNYKIKIRTATGCISYSTSVDLIPFLSTFPYFNSVDPIACGGTGSITITSIASSYSFDDGVTWTTNNIATNLPSGSYHIRTKDVAGCISNFNNVELNSEFLAAPLYISNNPYCGNLGDITITTPAALYSFDGGTVWQTSNTLNNLASGSYIIKIKDAQGCTSPTVYVYLNNLEDISPNYTLFPAGCGTYASITITTPGDLYSFDGGTTWTINSVKTNLISNTSYQILVKKNPNCQTYAGYVYVNSSYLPIPITTDYETTLCDDLNDGSENVDLTIYNSNLITNSAAYSFTYFNSFLGAENNIAANQITNITSCNISNTNNIVYVRVTSSDNCHKVAELKFILIASPIIQLANSYPLCEFKNVIINAGSEFDTYLWSTGETTQVISITQPGDYWVTVTRNHATSNGNLTCTTTKAFKIFLSNPATITYIETIDWTDNQNIITIFVTGVGNYEYSLDGINYQNSNQFSGLESGIYTVYVKDKNECGVVSDDVFLLMYPRYFTPNDDGFNDTWSVKFSIYEPGIKVNIFDRSGKFIKNLLFNTSWDGKYNGIELPSTDYWFVVTRANGKEYKGHFAMKR